MAESKMPARIWVNPIAIFAPELYFPNAVMQEDNIVRSSSDAQFVRADLVEPLVEALRRSREAVNAVVLSTHSVSFDADLRAIDAALSSWEAAQ